MKVEIDNRPVPFSSLSVGEVFATSLDDGRFFMKIGTSDGCGCLEEVNNDSEYLHHYEVNMVDIASGRTEQMHPTDPVVRIKGTFHVE